MRRGLPWILLAVVLFLLGAWIASGPEDRIVRARERRRERLEFPRHPRLKDIERQRSRRKHPAVGAPSAVGPAPAPLKPDDEEGASERAPLDPVLAALPPRAATALVLEASAVRDSPIGHLLIECLSNREDPFEKMREETGVDPIRDVDRVAFTGPGRAALGVVEGDFKALSGGAALTARGFVPRQVGEHGVIYDFNAGRPGDAAASAPKSAFATWGEGILLVGAPEAVHAAVDRLEGRAETTAEGPLPAGEAYGEIYGKISASDAAELLPPEVATPFRDAAESVLLHVDARGDLLLVGDVEGADPARMSELARTFGGALSAARLGARAQGEDDIVELLDLARVEPHPGSFRVEAALPLDWVRAQLADCLNEKTP